ncbi:Aminoacyl-tRNA hydrolase [Petrotoga mobilis SJ95]|uniref:Peptidyl-tRNA hydrolase n=1 Tax=Petrotoga mobilis (strain DSM 10674 / SJ95) TaxID=403833 RepID=A9BIJ1_PETMO|nr:aminoacyl-tRNA hydrolase [Petrotoga mobilis]ABX32154.1 Aminoacyl-tRNA hydrolase [Petrotoga mobilis SJ95]
MRNLVIGLGNPGPRYVFTKHNVGFLALDKYEENKKNISNIKKISGKNFEGFSIENDIFIKPLTYMNASGEVLPYVFKKFGKIEESLVIIYDDIWLNLGEIRIRKNGSDGGHNGLKSIIAILKSTDFPRIRIGINNGYEHGSGNLANYVLTPFTQEEWIILDKALDYVTITIDLILEGRINEAMNKFNKKII